MICSTGKVCAVAAVAIGLIASAGAQAPAAAGASLADVVQQMRAKNYPGAERAADGALRSQPNDPRLWTLKGMALAAEKPEHPSAALPAFDHALKIAPTYLPALEAAAQAEYTLGDSRARVHLEGVLAQQPANPTANAMLAVLDFRANNFAGAVEHFRAAQPVLADQPLALSQYAASLAGSGDVAGAIPVFQRLVELQPSSETARYNLALAEFRLRHGQDALNHLQPALAAQQPTEETLTLAAEIDESLAQTQPAVDLLRRAILLYPKKPDAYIALAHLSYAHSSLQVGMDILNAGIRQLPDEPRLYLSRGVLEAQLAQNEQSAADFDKAAALDPRLTLARTARGVAQSQQHHDDQALITFQDAVRAHPDNALTQYLLAEALSNANPAPDSKEGKEEMAAAQAAVHLDPAMADAQNLLATIYLRQEDFPRAAEHSKAALAVRPNDQQALYHLILTARRGVDKDQLPVLVKRLAAARDAGPDPSERPKGYLVEAN